MTHREPERAFVPEQILALGVAATITCQGPERLMALRRYGF
jgi:hypothetical protein